MLAVASQADRGSLSARLSLVLAKTAHLLCLHVMSPAGRSGLCVQASFNMSLVEFELVSVAAVQAEKPREANGTASARTTADGNAE